MDQTEFLPIFLSGSLFEAIKDERATQKAAAGDVVLSRLMPNIGGPTSSKRYFLMSP